MGLTLPKNVSVKLDRLQGKGKLAVATCTAIIAVTMAIVTFTSGESNLDELSAAGGADWAGPVGLLDTDYQHLVTAGKIAGIVRTDAYASDGVRDPMVAPSGALAVRPSSTQRETRAPAAVTLPNMWLSGIIWDPENPIVMIDGLDLHVGDSVQGARVVEIRMDSVVLSYKSKRYVLTVE